MTLQEQVKDFLDKQLVDFTNFRYEIEVDGDDLYVQFTEILGEDVEKECAFKIIKETLYFHSTTYGWKAVTKGSANKFFWIDLISE